jgi:hypothetical protein
LFATRIATARKPIAALDHHAALETVSACT